MEPDASRFFQIVPDSQFSLVNWLDKKKTDRTHSEKPMHSLKRFFEDSWKILNGGTMHWPKIYHSRGYIYWPINKLENESQER